MSKTGVLIDKDELWPWFTVNEIRTNMRIHPWDETREVEEKELIEYSAACKIVFIFQKKVEKLYDEE